ncbi:endonuclease/exonuclease/phosphatase family protein [Methanochimaera problematica]
MIGIEEIRDGSGSSIQKLMEKINSGGSEYSYVISERLGRTSSKEQYAYIFNTGTVELLGNPVTYPEPFGTDPFHREPYIASFQSKKGIFNATFVTIHTDPDEAKEEIDALYDVCEYSKNLRSVDENIIIMGDFNADGSYFDENGFTPLKKPGYMWLIGNEEDTTTRSTKYTYDRIVLTKNDFYIGESGVFRYDTKYDLTDSTTQAVSDHYPVYAVFSTGNNNDYTYAPEENKDLNRQTVT